MAARTSLSHDHRRGFEVTTHSRHVYLQAPGIVCSLGSGCAQVQRTMFAGGQSGMLLTDAFSPGAPCFVGRVGAPLAHLPSRWAHFDSRNNRLLAAALGQIEGSVRDAIGRFGRERIGVVIGTSTSGILESENAVADWVNTGAMPDSYDYQRQRLSSGSDFLSNYLDIGGPSVSISTACSLSAHAFAQARRLLLNDFCDVVIAGGADTLSRLTVRGFQSLESISRGISNPLSINRDGINIGEGACLMLMSKVPSAIGLLGAGASSDAHHISAPDPEGRGARDAMLLALADAGVGADAVD